MVPPTTSIDVRLTSDGSKCIKIATSEENAGCHFGQYESVYPGQARVKKNIFLMEGVFKCKKTNKHGNNY